MRALGSRIRSAGAGWVACALVAVGSGALEFLGHPGVSAAWIAPFDFVPLVVYLEWSHVGQSVAASILRVTATAGALGVNVTLNNHTPSCDPIEE